uniref:Uncharacterized protein n=1 Tax=Gopherus agassizii TaxID=38772 RepID=A0A452GRG8_9SAUR
MLGREINAEIEQWTRTPPDGLKYGWKGARLPLVPNHQARPLDPVDPGRGGRQLHGLASLHQFTQAALTGPSPCADRRESVPEHSASSRISQSRGEKVCIEGPGPLVHLCRIREGNAVLYQEAGDVLLGPPLFLQETRKNPLSASLPRATSGS